MINSQSKPVNIYEGPRKAPLISGWMLMHPYQMAKLFGMPIHKVIKDIYNEATAKRFTRAISGTTSLKSALHFAENLVDQMDPLGEFSRAFKGEPAARAALENMDEWECFCQGMDLEGKAQFYFLIEIERASRSLLKAASTGDLPKFFQQITNDDKLSNFVAAEDLQETELNPAQMSSLRTSMYLEGQLAYIALLDVLHSAEGDSEYSQLLPNKQWPTENTAARFFKYVIGQSDLGPNPSLKQIADHIGKFGVETLQRWRSGRNFISVDSLGILCTHFFETPRPIHVMNRYGAAILINETWLIAEEAIQKHINLNESMRGRVLPFGCDTVEEWFENRYPFWLSFHRRSGMSARQRGRAWV